MKSADDIAALCVVIARLKEIAALTERSHQTLKINDLIVQIETHYLFQK